MKFFITCTRKIANRKVFYVYFNEKEDSGERVEAGYVFKALTDEWLAVSSTSSTFCKLATKQQGIKFIKDQF